MKKLLLTIALALTAASGYATQLGETYQQVCIEFGREGFGQANGWYSFPSLDNNRSNTYCQFYNNHLECIMYAGPFAAWRFSDPMGGMYVTAGGRSFQEVAPAPNGMRRFLSYDKAVIAGLLNNNIMIVGWTDWMKQYATNNRVTSNHTGKTHHHVAAPKHQAAPPEVADVLPPYLQ